MAVKYPLANGNRSNAANRDSWTLPATGDEVRSNGYTVSIDIDLNAYSFTSIDNTGGGGFTCAIACTINSALITSKVSSTTCITTSHSSGTTVTINGNLTCDVGGSAKIPVSHTGTGTLFINGDITGYNSTWYNYNDGLRITSTGIVNITGNVSCAGNGGGYAGCGINVSGACTLNITGDVTGSPTAGGTRVIGIYSSGLWATINIIGNVQGGNNATSFGISLAAAQTVSITGIVVAKNANAINSTSAVAVTVIGAIDTAIPPVAVIPAISLTTGTLYFSGTITNRSKVMAIDVKNMVLLSTASQTRHFVNEIDNPKTMYTTDTLMFWYPLPADVRDAIIYWQTNEFTWTLKVPPPASVLLWVATDNTYGSLLMTPSDFINELNTSMVAVAVRLRQCATVPSTQQQIVALT